MSALEGKVVLVTGANGGLGTAVTRAFLDAGATTIGVARKIGQPDFSGAFTPISANLEIESEARNVVENAVGRFGRIDVLAHLVGGFSGGERVEEAAMDTWQQMFQLNFFAALYLLRAVIPTMRKARSGRIIAVGSRAAQDPGPRVGAYSASKAALVSLISTIARENKDSGITANVILPGTMDTPGNRSAMPGVDVSQWVQPASVASLIVWLATAAGRDVTGAAIPVYGAGL